MRKESYNWFVYNTFRNRTFRVNMTKRAAHTLATRMNYRIGDTIWVPDCQVPNAKITHITYKNTPKNAGKIGWERLLEYCEGNLTSRYVTHDTDRGIFRFHN